MPTPSTWSRNALPIEDARDFRDPMPAPMQVPNALDDVVADLARAAETYSRCSPGSKSPTPPLRLVPGTIGTMAPTAHVKATTLQAKCGPMLAPTVRHQGGRELPLRVAVAFCGKDDARIPDDGRQRRQDVDA